MPGRVFYKEREKARVDERREVVTVWRRGDFSYSLNEMSVMPTMLGHIYMTCHSLGARHRACSEALYGACYHYIIPR